ncbi:GAF domain-containing sensor histidine kinase [Robbsia sp. KACC 23696]|uniref:GAF domain-containing sensor histidine kinase n=1 Tax=Robbsia sp. KACC 23696 TaxID=3149231 RepID=UPI00325B6AE1
MQNPSFPDPDSPEAIAADVAAVARVSAVPGILRFICDKTQMGFAAVARVTDTTWTACAVHDPIDFGLKAGSQLELKTTLCFESRAAREPIVIDHFDESPVYCGHHTARIYNLQSYISVPIIFSDGRYFGNLCAIDPHPRDLADDRTVNMFQAYAMLIASQLENEETQDENDLALSNERRTAELREQFIAVLGHDLRNPLNAVNATAALLIKQSKEPDTVKLGLRLKTVVRRMAGLIDDVMDFARGRMGSGIGVDIRPSDDLQDALHNVVAELRDTYPEITIRDRIQLDSVVHCDGVRVQQLLSNLLGNAIKHGAHDIPIVVTGGIEDDYLVLSVSNGGKSIAPDSLEKVFEPYWRPPESVSGGGLGLGLFICKQIADAHGGEIRVTSSSIDGTCFMARLPVHGVKR